MKVLIVHAHHEPQSFNGAMTREAVSVLSGAGHDVIVSDLYAMRFDPVSDRRNFTNVADTSRLNQQAEEAHASKVGGYAPGLQAEMDKLAWCDILIFQFPFWWFGMPAILKGWIDRVFAIGRAYGGGRWFDSGMLSGKRALLSLTVGGDASVYSDIGAHGPIEAILRPIQHGILQFVGMDALEPFIVYGPSRMSDAQRKAELARYRERLLTLDAAQPMPMPKSADYAGLVRRQRADG